MPAQRTDEQIAEAVNLVCHDEQMTIWAGEIAGALSMGGYFRDLSYDEVVDVHDVIACEIKAIVRSAFGHPEFTSDDALTRAREAGAEAMRERAANVADRHRARIPNHNPDDQSGDLVSHGYGNAALNISVEIRALPLTEVIPDGS